MIGYLVAAWIGFLVGWLLFACFFIREHRHFLERGRGRTREISSYDAGETLRRAEARDNGR